MTFISDDIVEIVKKKIANNGEQFFLKVKFYLFSNANPCAADANGNHVNLNASLKLFAQTVVTAYSLAACIVDEDSH